MYNNDDYSEEEQEEEISSGNKFLDFYNNNKKMVWILIGIICFGIIISILTKNNGNTSVDETKKIEVVLKNSKNEIADKEEVSIGYSDRLIATVDDKVVSATWESGDTSIATVDNGYIRGVGLGTTVVTATYKVNGNNEKEYPASCTIIVYEGDINIKLTDVKFTYPMIVMGNNRSTDLDLTLTPAKGYISSKVFKSSDERVVKVDENTGRITSVGIGTAKISFNINDGDFKDDIEIIVVDKDMAAIPLVNVESINFQSSLEKIKIGQSYKLTYDHDPIDSDTSTLHWESSNTNVVTVNDNGLINGIAEGVAIVKVYSITGKEVGSITIEVETNIIDVQSVSTPYTNIQLEIGQTDKIVPIVKPDDASNKFLTYTSSDDKIAFVVPNDGGVAATIYGLKEGTAIITIKSNNNVTHYVTVNVVKPGSSSGSGGSGSGSGNGGSQYPNKNYTIKSLDANQEGSKLQYDMATTDRYLATGPLSVIFGFNSGFTGYLRVCHYQYGSSECTANSGTKISSSTPSKTYTLTQTGKYVIKVWEYNDDNTVRRGPDYWYTQISKTNSSSGSDPYACYVSVTSQGMGTDFTWKKESEKTSSQAKTLLSRDDCARAAAKQYCFRNNSTGEYTWNRGLAADSRYTYVVAADPEACDAKSTTQKQNVNFSLSGLCTTVGSGYIPACATNSQSYRALFSATSPVAGSFEVSSATGITIYGSNKKEVSANETVNFAAYVSSASNTIQNGITIKFTPKNATLYNVTQKTYNVKKFN